MKLWVLAEALTGYCLCFQIYTGKCGKKARTRFVSSSCYGSNGAILPQESPCLF